MVSILAEWKNSQNGTFESVHEIQKKFWPKDFFWGTMKVPYTEGLLLALFFETLEKQPCNTDSSMPCKGTSINDVPRFLAIFDRPT